MEEIGDSKNRIFLLSALFLVGMSVLGVGIILFRNAGDPVKVEVLSGEPEESISEANLTVEVAGAVMNPGVYKLPFESRVENALILAGGMSIGADRGWTEKYLNRAAKLADGQKIYIPSEGEMQKILDTGASTQANSSLININAASASELEDLWGVGEATAKKIIAGRPYGRIEELLERKILKENVYSEISALLAVY
jgi:competence protein ComEA